MPFIKFKDGTEVWVDEIPDDVIPTAKDVHGPSIPLPDDLPAHLRRGRFDKRRNPNQTERQHIESGLGRMYKAAKAFLLDDDGDDIAVAAKMLDKATKDK